jgi:hypothetical protein
VPRLEHLRPEESQAVGDVEALRDAVAAVTEPVPLDLVVEPTERFSDRCAAAESAGSAVVGIAA